MYTAKVTLSYTITDFVFFYWGQEAKEQSIRPKLEHTSKEHSGPRATFPASQIRWEEHTREGTSSHPQRVLCSSPSPASATGCAHGRLAVASLNGRRREGRREREKGIMQQYQQQMPCGSRTPWMASRQGTPVSLPVLLLWLWHVAQVTFWWLLTCLIVLKSFAEVTTVRSSVEKC